MPPRKKKPAAPAPDPAGKVRVYPHPSLTEGSFVAGVGADGADVSPEEAEALLAAGVVTTEAPVAPAREE